jgi:hypothetical protein
MLYIIIVGRVCSTYGRDKNAYEASVVNPDRKATTCPLWTMWFPLPVVAEV